MPETGPPGLESGGRKRAQGKSDCGPTAKAPDKPPNPTGYAPPLDSTTNLAMTPSALFSFLPENFQSYSVGYIGGTSDCRTPSIDGVPSDAQQIC